MAAAFPAAEKRTQSLPAGSKFYLAIINYSHRLVTPIFSNSINDSWKEFRNQASFAAILFRRGCTNLKHPLASHYDSIPWVSF